MKTFKETGRCTMTVEDVIFELQKLPSDTPVLATWEGICVPLDSDSFEIVKDFRYGHKEQPCDVLFIDCDQE